MHTYYLKSQEDLKNHWENLAGFGSVVVVAAVVDIFETVVTVTE